MSTYIKLIGDFERFCKAHPQATLEKFYQHMATLPKKDKSLGPKNSPESCNQLMRAVGRINSIFQLLLKTSLKTEPMEVPEGYPFLATLSYYGSMRKSELIKLNLLEVSTGTELISRLLKNKLVSEDSDEDDKRAKIVSITKLGKQRLKPFIQISDNLKKLMFYDISPEQTKAILDILQPVENKLSTQLSDMRKKIIEGNLHP